METLTLTEILIKADRINCLIAKAQRKFDIIVKSPFYTEFSNEYERSRDLVKMQMVIFRLQSYYYKTIELAREYRIG